MSHCWTSAFYYHLNHGLIILKNVEHRTKQRRLRVRRNIINITTKSHRSRAGIPSMRKHASKEISSASVELCETEICFLHIQLVGTNVWLPNIQVHLMLVLSLPGLLQNQNLEAILFCIVLLCCPENNIA